MCQSRGLLADGIELVLRTLTIEAPRLLGAGSTVMDLADEHGASRFSGGGGGGVMSCGSAETVAATVSGRIIGARSFQVGRLCSGMRSPFEGRGLG